MNYCLCSYQEELLARDVRKDSKGNKVLLGIIADIKPYGTDYVLV